VGDHCGVKDKDTIRILTQNINGMGQVADSLKEMNLKTFTSNKMVDILAIQELNVCWTKVAHRNKIWDRFRGWKESSHLSVAFNTEDKDAKVSQTGGTALISINKISHIWDSAGVDKSKLGRWAWTRYQGTEGRNLRVVSVYRPVVNDGYNSVYMQQLRYSVKKQTGDMSKGNVLNRLTRGNIGVEDRWR
jgi:hypothetical protein